MAPDTSARASFVWASRVGASWRRLPGARHLPPRIEALLSFAFGERWPQRSPGPQAQARHHDAMIGVCVVLCGVSPEAIAARAGRAGRTTAFAEAAARAWAEAERDPRAFRAACLLFRRARLSWYEGVAAGLAGLSDASRGPVFQRGRAHLMSALARRDTWAVVECLRAERGRAEGFAAGALGRVDEGRLLRDASYRLGTHGGMAVCARVGQAVVAVELRAREHSASCRPVV